jgi:hypothetical protein
MRIAHTLSLDSPQVNLTSKLISLHGIELMKSCHVHHSVHEHLSLIPPSMSYGYRGNLIPTLITFNTDHLLIESHLFLYFYVGNLGSWHDKRLLLFK